MNERLALKVLIKRDPSLTEDELQDQIKLEKEEEERQAGLKKYFN